MIGYHLNNRPFRNTAELKRLLNPTGPLEPGPVFSEEEEEDDEMSAMTETDSTDAGNSGGADLGPRPTVLYMLTTGFTVDWSRVSARLASHPAEAAARDRNGFSVLHHALARRDPAPIDVVRSLIDADAAAVRSRTNTGVTPLSIACWRRADLDILNALLDAEPGMANVPDRKGVYPLQSLWESYRNTFPQQESVWPHICALLRASYPDSRDAGGGNGNGGGGGILHAAAGSPWCCPLPVLRIAANRHRDQLAARDERGRLPLHVAAASSPNRPPSPPPGLLLAEGAAAAAGMASDDESSDPPPASAAAAAASERGDEHDDLSLLLRLNPDVDANVPDGNGRHPLFLAVASGRRWDQGIESFLEACPVARQSKDARSGLFLFQFAAANGSEGNVDTVFQLLKAAPHLVGVQDVL